MLVIGEELALKISSFDPQCAVTTLYLKFLGEDNIGLRIRGEIPQLWLKAEEAIVGPCLYNETYIFRVVAFDYCRNILWVKETISELLDSL